MSEAEDGQPPDIGGGTIERLLEDGPERCHFCDLPTDFPTCSKCYGPHNPLVGCTGPGLPSAVVPDTAGKRLAFEKVMEQVDKMGFALTEVDRKRKYFELKDGIAKFGGLDATPVASALPSAVPDGESLESQVQRLANFIMAEVPGEPSQSEGAIDTAIRLLRMVIPVVAVVPDGERLKAELERVEREYRNHGPAWAYMELLKAVKLCLEAKP